MQSINAHMLRRFITNSIKSTAIQGGVTYDHRSKTVRFIPDEKGKCPETLCLILQVEDIGYSPQYFYRVYTGQYYIFIEQIFEDELGDESIITGWFIS